MRRILAVDVSPSLAQKLQAIPGQELVLSSVTDIGDAIDHADPVAVVLGPTVSQPARVVAGIYRRDRHLPVLVLAEEQRLSQVQKELQISPFIGRGSGCLSTAAPSSELLAAVAEVARTSERRRAHARALARVDHRVLPDTLATDKAAASRYLGQLLDHAPVGVLTVDPEATIRGWNPMATDIIGRLARDAIGAPLTSLFRTEDAPALLQSVADALSGEGSLARVLRRTGREGTEQHVELTLAAIDPSVPTLGCLVLIQDVTERVLAQRELTDRARSATVAADVGIAFTSAEELGEKLQRCAEALVQHLDAAFARIWLTEPGTADLVLHASAGMYTHLDGPHGRVPIGSYKIGRIGARRRPHLTNQVVGDPEISDAEWAEREGMVAFAGYPLLLGEDLVGVMALFARHPLPHSVVQALDAIADTVAVGIEQALARERLATALEREHQARSDAELAAKRYRTLATTLQQSLLPPRLPDVPGLELSARYHWAGDGTTVGGDFYDAFVLRDGRCCAVMGDVSGKGVEAAKLTSLARNTLRTAALSCSSPAQLLATLNAALLQQVTGEEFCTVAVLVLEGSQDGMAMTAATAGHPSPVVVRLDGALDEVARPGPPAGLFDGARFTEVRAQLSHGDVVVLYTDGVTEARSPAGVFRPSLLTEVLARCGGWPAIDIVAAVESSVLAFEDAVPRDDLAVLAIRVSGARSRAPAGETASVTLGDELFGFRFAAHPACVPRARASLSSWLGARPRLLPASDVTLLVATELVTNAVRAARQEVELRVWEGDGGIVVEVRDDGYGMPTTALEHRPSQPDDESGRGLLLVRALSESCEADSREEGTAVRCHIALSPAPLPRPG
ncbi:MAG: SpoIIE family protein phosphatase [Acidimicrobiales bacterium]